MPPTHSKRPLLGTIRRPQAVGQGADLAREAALPPQDARPANRGVRLGRVTRHAPTGGEPLGFYIEVGNFDPKKRHVLSSAKELAIPSAVASVTVPRTWLKVPLGAGRGGPVAPSRLGRGTPGRGAPSRGGNGDGGGSGSRVQGLTKARPGWQARLYGCLVPRVCGWTPDAGQCLVAQRGYRIAPAIGSLSGAPPSSARWTATRLSGTLRGFPVSSSPGSALLLDTVLTPLLASRGRSRCTRRSPARPLGHYGSFVVDCCDRS